MSASVATVAASAETAIVTCIRRCAEKTVVAAPAEHVIAV
jgi:hypothetical protein